MGAVNKNCSTLICSKNGEDLISMIIRHIRDVSIHYRPIMLFVKNPEIKNGELYHVDGYDMFSSISPYMESAIKTFQETLQIYPNPKLKSIQGFHDEDLLFYYFPLNERRKLILNSVLYTLDFGDNTFLPSRIHNLIRESNAIFISK